MIQVTECEEIPRRLQFAIDQINKHSPDTAVMRHTKKGWAVYRTGYKPKTAHEIHAEIFKESVGAGRGTYTRGKK